ncbi:MAG: (2Fe-2S)-binding protein [Nitrospinae bacterium]|nr:(2Fe-2S)-binding protein [Nitrospinota bacterium]
MLKQQKRLPKKQKKKKITEKSKVNEIDNHEIIKARYKPGCICKGIKLHKILEAVAAGCRSFEEIKSKTNIGNGSCQGRRCGAKVKEILDNLD